jgi:hypothetical protein
MRRKIIGLAVVALAISFSAFTTHVGTEKNKKFGTYYWFLLDPGGNPQTMPHLIYQGSDPYNCSFIGMGYYCVAGYTSYTQDVYGYHAAGFVVVQHYYP